MENGAARLIVFGAGVKVDTVSRALWRAGAKLAHDPFGRPNLAKRSCVIRVRRGSERPRDAVV